MRMAKGRLSSTVVLSLMMAGLTALSAAAILAANVYASFGTVEDLIQGEIADAVAALREAVETDRLRFEQSMALLVEDHREGRVDAGAPETMIPVFRQLIGASPFTSGVSIDDARLGEGASLADEDVALYVSRDPVLPDAVAAAMEYERAHWLPPYFAEDLQETVVAYAAPLIARENGAAIGAAVSGGSLVGFAGYAEAFAAGTAGLSIAFVYEDRWVLASSEASAVAFAGAAERPFASAVEFEGLPIGAYLTEQAAGVSVVDSEIGARIVTVGAVDYVALTAALNFGDLPIDIVGFLPEAAVGGAFDALELTFVLSLALIAIAVGFAILMGRHLGFKLERLTRAIEGLSKLDLAPAAALPASRVREVDAAVSGVKNVASALTWLQAYAPKDLAPILLATQMGEKIPSEKRDLTIMFTDLVGFTTLSERLAPEETSRLVNDHLELVGAAIGAVAAARAARRSCACGSGCTPALRSSETWGRRRGSITRSLATA